MTKERKVGILVTGAFLAISVYMCGIAFGFEKVFEFLSGSATGLGLVYGIGPISTQNYRWPISGR